MPATDLSITVKSHRPLCVLDPALGFAHPAAVLLVQRLSTVLDVFMPQAFFRVLDSSEFYSRQPATLLKWLGLPESAAGSLRHTLTGWGRLRGSGDVLRAPYYWLSDSLPDSRLPERFNGDFLRQAELLNAALHRHLMGSDSAAAEAGSLSQESALDTFTLASALGGAFVLTASGGGPGSLRQLGKDWAFSCTEQLSGRGKVDPYALDERDWLRSLVVQSMASVTLWQGLQLSVMHVLSPYACTLDCSSPAVADTDPLQVPEPDALPIPPQSLPNPWEGTHLWWYAL